MYELSYESQIELIAMFRVETGEAQPQVDEKKLAEMTPEQRLRAMASS